MLLAFKFTIPDWTVGHLLIFPSQVSAESNETFASHTVKMTDNFFFLNKYILSVFYPDNINNI